MEDISKLSKSNKGSIKGDNQNHQQYYSMLQKTYTSKNHPSTFSSGTLDSYLRATRVLHCPHLPHASISSISLTPLLPPPHAGLHTPASPRSLIFSFSRFWSFIIC
ncbi:hypothetical protein CMV_010824 [Castanea mollissima]|uniref:Uncharacterized protein n=1 Tax=Castanea mollissima TaxID=60419 RepID=A0A8J4VLG9_9ROSI|nr:hypothetical protein CMV_010824 [Castanea mollissima]